MATLSRIPFSLSFSTPDKLLFCHKPNIYSTNKRFTVCFGSSIKRPRVRKKVKSNEELRKEIVEFASAVGFPQGHIPSTKELSEHGRNDLANIVRRRGYKFMRELLVISNEAGVEEVIKERIMNKEQDMGGVCELDTVPGQDESLHHAIEDELSPAGISSTGNFFPTSDDNACLNQDENGRMGDNPVSTLTSQTLEVSNVVESDDSRGYLEEDAVRTLTSKDEEVKNIAEDVSSSTDVPVCEHYTSPNFNFANSVSKETTSGDMNGWNQRIDNSIENFPEGLNDSPVLDSGDKDCTCGDASSIEEKVARFIQNGDLDTIEDYAHGIGADDSEELIESNSYKEHMGHDHSSKKISVMTANGSVLALKDATLAATENHSPRDDHPRAGNADFFKDPQAETVRRENQVEINRLKFLLHQKELELSHLKEQIEKEKLALSVLQKKAETEINNAQKLISEKDAELQAAEESLSGLKEVEIQYSGEGDIVEVTGSFNGWQHRIEMVPQLSNVVGSVESRKPRCWSTLLWLYPGTYEIKFIVDGQWRIDPQKESVTKGQVTNNVLKVEG